MQSFDFISHWHNPYIYCNKYLCYTKEADHEFKVLFKGEKTPVSILSPGGLQILHTNCQYFPLILLASALLYTSVPSTYISYIYPNAPEI